MRPTRWRQLEDLVNTVLELPPEDRPRFLDEACGSDLELRRQVEELVSSFAEAGNFLEDAIGEGIQQSLLSAAPTTGDRLGPYKLIAQIGHGGMGLVFRAIRDDDQFRQQVAIKIIGSGLVLSQELVTRFRAERQILAMLSHPNIGHLLDGGLTPAGVPYLVMEFIEGESIDRFVQERHLSILERLELFRKVCYATHYAHQNLIVHRDIKPANVLVTAEGEPKLVDFGIAKLLEPGSFGQTVAHTAAAERLMTPGYASPEQIRGEPVTTATDVYALGVLLYELLTGKAAFETRELSPASVERLITETAPPRPSVLARERISPDLDTIVMKAMHKEAARRYVSAAELADDVRRYMEGFPVTARPDSWRYQTSKFVSRHKLAVTAAVLVLIAIAGLGAGLIVQRQRALHEAKTAEGVATFLSSLFRFSRPDVNQGRNLSARDILDMGASRIPRELASEPEVQARLLVTIGAVYYSLGAYDQAEVLGKQAVEVGRRIEGKNSITEAESNAFVLAQVELARGKYDEAARLLDRASPVLKAQNNVRLANVLVISALGYWHRGDLNNAELRMREAIEIDKRLKGSDHRDTLGAQGNLGLVLMDQEKYAEADAVERETLELRLRTLGPRHPDVAINTGNLGDVQKATEQWQAAAKTYRLAVQRYHDAFGLKHPRCVTPPSMLAEVEAELGHYDEALSFNAQALDLSNQVLGPLAAITGQVLLARGMILTRHGQFDEARQAIDQGLSILHKRFAPGDPHFPLAGEIRGELELAQGDLAAAQRDFTDALDFHSKKYGNKGLHVATSMMHVADVLDAKGDHTAAETRYREAIQAARAKWTGDSTTVAHALFGLGRSLAAEGKRADAQAPLRESLEIRRRLLPAGHPDIAAAEAAARL